jgi:hypothetical protein
VFSASIAKRAVFSALCIREFSAGPADSAIAFAARPVGSGAGSWKDFMITTIKNMARLFRLSCVTCFQGNFSRISFNKIMFGALKGVP